MSSSTTSNITVIADICQHPGPFLSTYLDVSRNVDEAAHRLQVRWRSAQEQLRRLGAPANLIELVGERMLAPTEAPGQVAPWSSRQITAQVTNRTVACCWTISCSGRTQLRC